MPVLFGSGVQGQYDYLVINLLGASLDSLYRQSSKKVMDLRSVCCIAMQVVGIDALCETSFVPYSLDRSDTEIGDQAQPRDVTP